MQTKVIWQQNSQQPDNTDNLALISQWWSSLANQGITFAQRLIPDNGALDQINWETQRFDEFFPIANPQIRGITLYWCKLDSDLERNTLPYQLVLDTRRQQLYIFPQSQNQLIIRVGLPEVSYEKVEITNPEIECKQFDSKYLLTLRDTAQHIEVKVTLTPENLSQLKQKL
ncbi:hypothetical protein [Synechocystis sp. PCC 7509]|uniref:hypothetical protein n=1 Tax=Synechocystis sp. PCC 7509 TaxID=927677 RepID=UPI0002ABF43C|nr:hypothetical protein [Synechocystis sp. PCC 7509]